MCMSIISLIIILILMIMFDLLITSEFGKKQLKATLIEFLDPTGCLQPIRPGIIVLAIYIIIRIISR